MPAVGAGSGGGDGIDEGGSPGLGTPVGGGGGASVAAAGAQALQRVVFKGEIDLDSVSAEYAVDIAAVGGKRAVVTIKPGSGCTGVLKLQKRVVGLGLFDFSTAKTLDLTAATDSEALTEDELAGCERLCLVGPGTAQSGKSVLVSIVVDVDR